MIRRGSKTRFDLGGNRLSSALEKEIDLTASNVAVEENRGHHAPVEEMFNDLGNDPRFENRSPERMDFQLIRSADTQQIAQQTAVIEVELGCFYEAFADVAKKR